MARPPPKKPRLASGPASATEAQLGARARGALLGLAVGEALGVPLEGRQRPAAPFPELNPGPYDQLLGGGARALRPGQASWGAALAGCLAASLQARAGYEGVEVARAYARWVADAVSPPESVARALALFEEGRPAELCGRRLWLDQGQRLDDNVALVRSAPLGVYFARQRRERVDAALADTGLTHFAPTCRLAAVALDGALAAALTTPEERLAPEGLVRAVEAELRQAGAELVQREPEWAPRIRVAEAWLRDDLRLAGAADPELYGPELHLFATPTSARVTLRLALWEALHAPDFEAGLLDAANRGGDAPANAAVTGALLGALYGEGAIPARWTEALLAAPAPTGASGRPGYHPRALLALQPREASRG
jgi:ADP-ribosyl-[dinitrogen reductase] hydrolase